MFSWLHADPLAGIRNNAVSEELVWAFEFQAVRNFWSLTFALARSVT